MCLPRLFPPLPLVVVVVVLTSVALFPRFSVAGTLFAFAILLFSPALVLAPPWNDICFDEANALQASIGSKFLCVFATGFVKQLEACVENLQSLFEATNPAAFIDQFSVYQH